MLTLVRAGLAGLLVATLACGRIPGTGGVSTAPTPDSSSVINVVGTIDRGSPVSCPPGEPCDPQIVAARVVFSRPGHPDTDVWVGTALTFSTHLDQGDYSVSVSPPPSSGRVDPSVLRVPPSGTVRLNLRIVQ